MILILQSSIGHIFEYQTVNEVAYEFKDETVTAEQIQNQFETERDAFYKEHDLFQDGIHWERDEARWKELKCDYFTYDKFIEKNWPDARMLGRIEELYIGAK